MALERRFEMFGGDDPERLAATLEAIVYLRRHIKLDEVLDIAEQLLSCLDFFGERGATAFVKRYCSSIHLFRFNGCYECRYRSARDY